MSMGTHRNLGFSSLKADVAEDVPSTEELLYKSFKTFMREGQGLASTNWAGAVLGKPTAKCKSMASTRSKRLVETNRWLSVWSNLTRSIAVSFRGCRWMKTLLQYRDFSSSVTRVHRYHRVWHHRNAIHGWSHSYLNIDSGYLLVEIVVMIH